MVHRQGEACQFHSRLKSVVSVPPGALLQQTTAPTEEVIAGKQPCTTAAMEKTKRMLKAEILSMIPHSTKASLQVGGYYSIHHVFHFSSISCSLHTSYFLFIHSHVCYLTFPSHITGDLPLTHTDLIHSFLPVSPLTFFFHPLLPNYHTPHTCRNNLPFSHKAGLLDTN